MDGATVSVSAGSVAMKHDRRDYKPGRYPKNVDENLSCNNKYFKTCMDAREEFNDFFKEEIDEYNAKQKRTDRKIDDYYDKIRRSKNKETPIYEYVFQIGNKDTNEFDKMLSIEILTRYAEQFQENNSNFHVLSNVLHVDEPNGTPHLHIAFIPFAEGYKTGINKRCSVSMALESMGYYGENRNMRSWKQKQEETIEKMMSEYGIERIKYGSKRDRVDVETYKEIKDRALADVKAEKEQLQNEISSLKEEVQVVKAELSEKRSILKEIEKHIENNLATIKMAVKGLFKVFRSALVNSLTSNYTEIEKDVLNAQKQAQNDLGNINPTIRGFVEEEIKQEVEEKLDTIRRRRGR